MKSKEISINTLTSLMEELSDEEAGACVGGTGNTNPAGNPLGWGALGKRKNENNQSIDYDDSPGGTRRTRSDRNQKEHFAAVDVQEVLTKVATLPIEKWNYKDQNPTIRHIGPMAQDFAAAFKVGEDDRFIEVVDANGVALAAIQGLYKLLQDKDAEFSAMRAELDELKQQMLESKVQTSITMPTAALSCN